MFDPKWTKGCPGCTGFVNALGDLSMLAERDTAFVLISRAPLAKLRAYQKKMGWANRTWVSSAGSDFNYDFHVSLDEAVAPVEYNFKRLPGHESGEAHGLSVFSEWGRTSSTRTRPTLAAWKASPMPTACSMSRPTADRRIGKIPRAAGHKGRPTAERPDAARPCVTYYITPFGDPNRVVGVYGGRPGGGLTGTRAVAGAWQAAVFPKP